MFQFVFVCLFIYGLFACLIMFVHVFAFVFLIVFVFVSVFLFLIVCVFDCDRVRV